MRVFLHSLNHTQWSRSISSPSLPPYTPAQSLVLTCSSSIPLDSDPPEEHHGAVMVDMEDGDLVVFLAQDEKECVEKLNNFGEVVQPYHRCKLFVGVCVCVGVCVWVGGCGWGKVWQQAH